ncbi:MAG: Ada metal-binding domain-containing protein [Burkholderiaceae bacterium]
MDSTTTASSQAPAPAGLVTDPQACYRALVSRDERFDGRFFVGVRTTRIYCRPVCRVRMPRAENCRFYVSAAAAEGAGFRPCLRCRPELAPGQSAIDATDRLAAEAARLIERDLADAGSLAGLAASLGVSDRHLRRVFEATYGVRPVAWRQTRRLLLAKRLLTDTDLPVIEVAGAAGFKSLRRFNASIRESYRLSPTELRGSAGGPRDVAPAGVDDEAMVFQCTWRAPYDWPWICAFLGSRAIGGVEHVAQQRYSRTLTLAGPRGPICGWLSAAPGRRANTLAISMSATLAPRSCARAGAGLHVVRPRCRSGAVPAGVGRSGHRRGPACACPGRSMRSRSACGRYWASRSRSRRRARWPRVSCSALANRWRCRRRWA